MTPLDFIARLRQSVLFDEGGDVSPPPSGYRYSWEYDDVATLWKNEELIGFLNDARTEYYRRIGVIQTSSLFVYPEEEVYSIPGASEIERILNARGEPLAKVTHEEVDWDSFPLRRIDGRLFLPASYYYEDSEQSAVRLLGSPTAEEELTLVIRLLRPWSVSWDQRKADDCAAIPEAHYPLLLHWAAHLAYLKHDSETLDIASSDRHAALFAQQVAPPIPVEIERWRRGTANRYCRAMPQYM